MRAQQLGAARQGGQALATACGRIDGRSDKAVAGAYCTSKPPNAGPIKGPIKAGMTMKAITGKNASRGNARSTASRPTGTKSAPPTPCTTRASA